MRANFAVMSVWGTWCNYTAEEFFSVSVLGKKTPGVPILAFDLFVLL